ncbi:MAG: DUF2892 domain-containing protein [Chloroflexota bacterium]
MTRNVGMPDRIMLGIVGLVLVIIGIGVLGPIGGAVLALIGVVLLLTGLVGFCPLYRLLGIDTAGRAGRPQTPGARSA